MRPPPTSELRALTTPPAPPAAPRRAVVARRAGAPRRAAVGAEAHRAAGGAAPPRTAADAAHAGQLSPIRVVLADDRALARHGLLALLGGEEDIEVTAGASDMAAPAGPATHHPDVLVLDLGLSGRFALAAISRQRERAPDTQIVVLTGEREPLFAERTLSAGALGFVTKTAAETELPVAIRAVARGERFVSASVATGLDARRRSFGEDGLTAREVEVLRLIAFGHTSVEIAHTLELSPRTVETHRGRIHKKLRLTTRAELVSYALRRRLLRT